MRLYNQLKNIQKENLISFHVPGHKSHPIVQSYFDAFQNILELDLTEIPGTDDLHDAESCILEAEEFAKNIYGSISSHFLVNGTTSGLYAMIMAVTEPGDTLLIQRDCHKAVYQALFLGRVKGVSIQAEMLKSENIPLGLTIESVVRAFEKNPQAKGIVLTYPNYYGIASDLKSIVDYVHSLDKLVLVDAAHGAHLTLNDSLPPCAIKCGSDIVVQSSHKSLPVMTQSSLLHLNTSKIDTNKLRRMLRLHQSSSPSYVLMSSLDIGLTIMDEQGEFLMGELLSNIKDFHNSNSSKFLTKKMMPNNFFLDTTKLVYLGFSNNVNPQDLEKQLRENGIQIEFSNENVAVFVSSIMNTSEDFQELSKKMENLSLKWYSGNENVGYNLDLPIVMSLSEAYYKNSEMINISEAVGRISKDYIIPYPPGVPLVIPGERITESLLKHIKLLCEKKQKINGLYKKTNTEIKIEVIILEEDQ